MRGAWGTRRWRWLLVVWAFAGCQETTAVRSVLANAFFDEADLNFGDVPVGEWREREVRIRNVGRVPFRAIDALNVTGDPSFVVELDRGPVMPGEARRVLVRFRPLFEGEVLGAMRLSTDADDHREAELPMRGVGTPAPIRILPEQLDFQTLEVDSERLLELTVENPVDLPLTVVLTGESTDAFTTDAVTVPPLSSLRVNARFSPRLTGPHSARLEIRPCPTCTPATAELIGSAVATAFSFDPTPVPFDSVPVHERTRSRTRATNVTWRPVTVDGVTTSDPAFTPLTPLGGQTVDPGGAVEVEIEYAPRSAGPAVATLTLGYTSDRARASEVLLDATGGRPQLAIAPVAIDFGELPVGGKAGRVVRLTNAGTLGNLVFQGVRATGDVWAFGVSPPFRGATVYPWAAGSAWPQLPAAVEIAPGADFLDVTVFFQPDRTGELRAELAFRADDPFTPERTVVVTGRARPIGPCRFRVLPEGRLDFGNVPVGRGAVLGFRFENTGDEECAVKDIHLSRDAGGAFFMPGGPLAGGVVLREDSFAAQIAFRGPAEGRYEGELSITVSDPTQPVFHLPLQAMATASCLSAAPPYLDFGAIRYDCAPRPRRTYVSNQCAHPLTVDELRIGPGTSDQFGIVTAPPLPIPLAPGAGFEVVATYARTVHGQHYSPLWIGSDLDTTPLLVPLLAETNHDGLQVERFVQGTDDELDVLFVVANSTTMQPYQDRLRADMPGWLGSAAGRGVDLRVGVTSTGLVPRGPSCPGGADGGEAGRLFPVDGSRPRVVSGTSLGAATALQHNLEVGLCHNLVQGLETMRAALSPPLSDHADDPRTAQPNDGNLGLLRPTARLAVVFLADEDDHSGFDPEAYAQFLRALKGPGMGHRIAAYAIVPTDGSCMTAGPAGTRFLAVAHQTGGEALSICRGSYEALLDQLTTRATGLQAEFVLGEPPTDPAAIEVRVDGIAPPDSAWSYDPARNAVVFAPGAIPGPGQVIEVRYRAECWEPPP